MLLESEIFKDLPQWAINHIVSFVGSFLYCCYILWVVPEKDKIRKSLRVAIIILFGQGITLIQEFIFEAYVMAVDNNAWDWYYDLEEFVSFVTGVLGIHIFTLILNFGKRKINGS